MKKKHPLLTLCLAAATAGAFGAAAPLAHAAPANLFVEAESFQDQGGWVLDTQFIDAMGSPYLMAHGLGKPVKDASTTVKNATAGKYRVWIRTKNWVGPWDAPGAPGRFQVSVNGKSLGKDFGTQGKDWLWEDGGEVELPAGETKLSIQDQTGFNGRVDAILFTSDLKFTPPSERKELASFRHKSLGLPDEAPATKEYDLVVVGGGYAGMGAAISGARQGLSVALVQNRPVLGGNGSSEVQVWAQGGTRRGLYPHLGEIVEEFTDRASNSPGFVEEYGDALKEKVVRDEKSIDLYLNNHVWKVEMAKGKDKKIVGAIALNVKTGEEKNIRGKFFVDSTGHGNLGALAEATYTMLEKGHLGMSNMWVVSKTEKAQDWPETPWALDLEPDKDFPTPKVFKPLKNNVIGANNPAPDLSHFKVSDFLHGEWFWESGFDKHPIEELEIVRDWNLRALFGAFSGLRKKDPAKYADYAFQWVAYVGGTRESRLLIGDVVLNEDDIVSGKQFPDGCVPTTWDIDLHYPKEQYMTKYKDNPFISRAAFGKGVDRKNGYPIPYRSFYSKNVENLFMAGRNISVDHNALGTIRVMRTCGMMGEVVGKAAYLTVRHQTTPRGVYEQYLDNLKDLMTKPGAMRRDSIEGQLYLPANAAKLPELVEDSINPAKLEGLVIDDEDAELTGTWTKGEGLKPHVNKGYSYTGTAGASARFPFSVKETGTYEVRIAWQPHQNRGTTVPVSVLSADGQKDFNVDQSKPAELKLGFHSLGKFKFEAGAEAAVTFRTEGAKGNVHLDAVQVLPAK